MDGRQIKAVSHQPRGGFTGEVSPRSVSLIRNGYTTNGHELSPRARRSRERERREDSRGRQPRSKFTIRRRRRRRGASKRTANPPVKGETSCLVVCLLLLAKFP